MQQASHRLVLYIVSAVLLVIFSNVSAVQAKVQEPSSSTPPASSSASPLSAPPKEPAYREVTDETGRNVRVPVAIHRIVSLAPSLTETIYALGLQDRLVGDTDYCDYPEDAQKKPKVGDTINPSIEQIAALRPDIVLATKSLNRLDTVRALDGLKIPTYATDPHTIDQVISSTLQLAEILGATDAGAGLAADLHHRLENLQQRLANVPPRRVLFVVWTEPLISIGKDTFIADALRHAGAVSVIDSTESWPQVSLEEVVHQQPEFLVFPENHSQSLATELNALSARPGWRGLDAMRNRRFAIISDAVNRPAPRIVSAIEDLARQLHPEAFVEVQQSEPTKLPASPKEPNGVPKDKTEPEATPTTPHSHISSFASTLLVYQSSFFDSFSAKHNQEASACVR